MFIYCLPNQHKYMIKKIETLQSFLPESDRFSSHEWDMETQPGRPETERDIYSAVESRLVVYDTGDADAPADGLEFTYAPDAYHTAVEEWDAEEDYTKELKLSLAEYLEDEYVSSGEKREIIDDIVAAYEEEHPEIHDGWWLQIHDLTHSQVERDFFQRLPTEQFIVGQENTRKGVRFYNYSQTMDEAHVADCVEFVNVAIQYLGEATYDILHDVIIIDFDQDSHSQKLDGFVERDVVFINARLLREEPESAIAKNISRFREVMVHEFGHLVHGHGDEAYEQLEEFSAKAGWNVEGMKHDDMPWHVEGVDVMDYAPSALRDRVDVTMPDGTIERMTTEDYYDRFEDDYDEMGNDLRPSFEYADGSLPSQYARKNPFESSAETTAHAMLGGVVMGSLMPETRDAWLDHLERRRGSPIATPLHKESIIYDHRTGTNILYPTTHLPDSIPVIAKVDTTAKPA